MSITPNELRRVRFALVRKGYDTEAVDTAIERVADSIEALLQERQDLADRLRSLEAEIDRYREVESTLSETLLLAERAGEELKAEARAEAEAIVRTARAEASSSAASTLPDPAFLELLGETRAIRSLLQTLMTQAPEGDGDSPFTPRNP